MALSSTKQLGRISWVSLFALGLSAHAQSDDWLRHFRIGASFGMNIKTDFRTSGTFGSLGSNPGGIDPGVNHEYDNGYVRVDATGNAAPPGGPRQTTNFSYNDPGQYDPVAETLTFQSTRNYTASGTARENDQPNLGFDLAYGSTIRKWNRVAIGWEFGFNFNLLEPTDRNPMAATATAFQYQYSTTGILPANLAAGTPGNPSGAGTPGLNATPTENPLPPLTGSVTGERSLDATLYNFRLGPLLRWEFFPRWTLNGSAGIAFSVLSADYVFNENVALANGTTTVNRGRFGATEFSFGGYAGGIVMYDTGYHWEPYLGAHFQMMQDMDVSKNGRSANVDLGSAVIISAGINWTF